MTKFIINNRTDVWKTDFNWLIWTRFQTPLRRQKYSATRRIFNSLHGVWRCGLTLIFVFKILLKSYLYRCLLSSSWFVLLPLEIISFAQRLGLLSLWALFVSQLRELLTEGEKKKTTKLNFWYICTCNHKAIIQTTFCMDSKILTPLLRILVHNVDDI